MIDLAALFGVLAFAGLGWKRGAKAMALWGFSLVAGSLAATFLTRPVGTWLASTSGLSLLVAAPLAGVGVAGFSTGVVRTASRRVGRERKAMLREGWVPPVWDPWIGTALGTVCGVGVVLFAAWVGSATADLHGREAELRASAVGRAAAQVGEPVIRMVAGQALGDAVLASTAAFLMSDPEKARETMGALLTDPRIRGLAGDPAVRIALTTGNVEALGAMPGFRDLAGDPAFVTAARRVRLAPSGDLPTLEPGELADALTERLGPLVQAAEALAANPQVQAVLRDPAFKEALAKGDIRSLLAEGGLDRLMTQISSQLEQIR